MSAERAHPDHPGFREKSPYRKKLFERYQFCNQFIKEWMTVLDVPCGVGWGTSLFDKCRRLYGLDISNEAIKFATEHYHKDHIKFVCGDMTKMPFSIYQFDMVICLDRKSVV